MSECYPTGCTPCDTPISFPEDPVNGDIYCIDIGGDSRKCWTYDSCIPGWRAQGPSASPAVYRGGINIKVDSPGENIEAGHFYIQIGTVTAPYQLEWGLKVAQVSPVVANSRIAFNGQEWEVIPGPEVPYAEEALDLTPLPDTRIGGITKNASLQDALAGTKKCDAITPYTLKNVVDEEIGKLGIGDGKFELTYDGAKSTFTANQATGDVVAVNIPAPGNGTVTFTQAGTNIGSITMNQSGNTTLDFTDNVSGPGAEVPGQFAAMINSTDLKFARGISSMSRINKGVYQYNFETTQTGISFDNVFYQVSTNSGGSPTMAATIGMHILDEDKFIVLTGYNNSSPDNNGNQTISIWRLS
jgi:hypothetical protein